MGGGLRVFAVAVSPLASPLKCCRHHKNCDGPVRTMECRQDLGMPTYTCFLTFLWVHSFAGMWKQSTKHLSPTDFFSRGAGGPSITCSGWAGAGIHDPLGLRAPVSGPWWAPWVMCCSAAEPVHNQNRKIRWVFPPTHASCCCCGGGINPIEEGTSLLWSRTPVLLYQCCEDFVHYSPCTNAAVQSEHHG